MDRATYSSIQRRATEARIAAVIDSATAAAQRLTQLAKRMTELASAIREEAQKAAE